MSINFNDYKYVIRVSYDNHHAMYYNSGNYVLVANPSNASRYKTNEGHEKDIKHAASQGGDCDMIYFSDALENYKGLIKNYEDD